MGGLTRLTAIDTKNIIGLSDEEDEQSTGLGTPPASSAPSSNYSLRNRNAKQSALKYDVKYHPMDDSIRPTQAARRREAHGEAHLGSDDDDENESFSVRADSDTTSDIESDEERKPAPAKKGSKRGRRGTQSIEPTRRSSRRTASRKVSYDMSKHPQDLDLIIVSSDSEKESDEDENDDAPPPTAKRQKSRSSTAKTGARRKAHTTPVIRSGFDSDVALSSVESNNGVDDVPTEVPG